MYPNAWYHVMNRGRRGEQVFKSKDDYECFIAILHEALELFALRVSAYCLMQNHYHLLVQTPDANLDRCMRHINGVYTQRYNSAHGLDGPLFRGRYKAIVVGEDSYLLQLVRYIHRNPVRAGIVEKPEQYRWSSHKGYLSSAKKWNWLHKKLILSMLAKQQPMQRIRKYRAFMAEAEDETLLRTLSLKKLPSILGDNDFVNKLKNKFFKQKQHIEVPESKRLAPEIGRIKKVLCDYYSIDEDQLYYTKRAFFNEARAIGVYLSRQLRGESLKRIGEQFEIRNYSTASTVIQRLKARLQSDRS
ncbi:transposase, partial [Desulfosarcina sp.]|nr:transposase [Desulfosarcina sp.]